MALNWLLFNNCDIKIQNIDCCIKIMPFYWQNLKLIRLLTIIFSSESWHELEHPSARSCSSSRLSLVFSYRPSSSPASLSQCPKYRPSGPTTSPQLSCRPLALSLAPAKVMSVFYCYLRYKIRFRYRTAQPNPITRNVSEPFLLPAISEYSFWLLLSFSFSNSPLPLYTSSLNSSSYLNTPFLPSRSCHGQTCYELISDPVLTLRRRYQSAMICPYCHPLR